MPRSNSAKEQMHLRSIEMQSSSPKPSVHDSFAAVETNRSRFNSRPWPKQANQTGHYFGVIKLVATLLGMAKWMESAMERRSTWPSLSWLANG